MAFLDTPAPLAFAHRGGALLAANDGIENTLAAFQNAVDLGYRYLETDVHSSRDGVVYAFHDIELTRMTGTVSAFRDLDSEAIDAIRVGGREPIPRLSELLETFPEARFNIDAKADDAVDPMLDVLRKADALDRVCLASFSESRLLRMRAGAPTTPTCLSPGEIARLRLAPRRSWQARGVRRGGACLQVPSRHGSLTLVTPGFVRRAHDLGLPVHVWTVDDPDEMRYLLDIGVDGLMSDRVDVLRDVLLERDQWR
ncbi:glycerophosphodiester phosphodiesterase [Aeromicrobium sp.]|uniref:glycerophosphodiester phosphodiesterase n=1 Tax=Aeromicrobium sp. TaxID=1871063 RepID=UPI003D6A60CD